ncbi:hypothetical protein [Alkalihalobacillus sp. R86527]|uniref:hypothetical protein n=1 Tax=Alkalihalobacillus sp. R86527 TaxID=3093863 RepID=UPI003670491A
MKKTLLITSLLASVVLFPKESNAVSMPCSMVLNPIDEVLTNARGSALVYKVQLIPPSFARTNISILSVHLPEPSTQGEYDIYEGFAFIPDEISWRFKLYPTPEEDSPTWAGRIDIITAKLKNAKVQVRASNSKTEKLGPVVLENDILSCK